MTTPLCFVDTETLGLDPRVHPIWEVCFLRREADGHETMPMTFQIQVGPELLAAADPVALEINRFHERYDGDHALSPEAACHIIRAYTEGAHLVGNVVSFDEERLRRVLWANNHQPTWHYHLIDVESMIAGLFGLQPPWKSTDLSRMIEIEPPNKDEAHTALADVLWAKAEYDRVMRIANWTRSHVKRAVIDVRNGNDQVRN